MTENQSTAEGTQSNGTTGEPGKPDLMGYETPEALAAAKRASDAEFKRKEAEWIAERDQMRARLDAIESERDTASPDPEGGEDGYEQETLAYVRKGDPVATYSVEKIKKLERGIVLRDQLRDIDDRGEREATRKRFIDNPGKYGDINAAHEAVLAERRAQELDEARAEKARLEEELRKHAKRPDPNVAQTVEREVTAGRTGQIREMTNADYAAEKAALEAAGDFPGAHRLGMQLVRGNVRLKG